jgi:hypothetical protein
MRLSTNLSRSMYGRKKLRPVCFTILLFMSISPFTDAQVHTNYTSYSNIDSCIELSNKYVKVILDPATGGRVIEYSSNGNNVLFTRLTDNPGLDRSRLYPDGGRFDIGPEKIAPGRPLLWRGKWRAEIVEPGKVRLISHVDPAVGIRIIREYSLNKTSSQLKIMQTMINESRIPQRYCFWSRTLAKGGGICLIPLNPKSRYPNGFVITENDSLLNYSPELPEGTKIREGIFEIQQVQERPKFNFDSEEGWIAYLTKSNQIFIKKFNVYPEEIYGDVMASNISIWYSMDNVCEIEPMSPWVLLKPGEHYSFEEVWYLLNYDFPDKDDTQIEEIRKMISDPSRSL